MPSKITSKSLYIFIALLVFSFSTIKLAFLIRQRYEPINISQITITDESQKIVPVRLEIATSGIYLPITEAAIINRKWEYSDNSVLHLKDSPLPGDVGNSIFYGHNWPNLLGNLKTTKNGDVLKIHLSNGNIRSFKAISTYVVTPDQTHILNQTDDSVVTIYTCTGFLDSKRLVVLFVPVTENLQ